MDTRETIEKFNPGQDHWYYDAWMGFVGGMDFPINTWYSAECSGPGERSVNGPHRATPEEAEEDANRLFKGDEYHPPYKSARIVRNSPAIRISIEKELT